MTTHPEWSTENSRSAFLRQNAFRVLPARFISTDARVRVPAFPRSAPSVNARLSQQSFCL